MRNIMLSTVGAFVLVLVGCGSDGKQTGEGPGGASGIVYTETSVTFNADGTMVQTYRPITLEEELADMEARRDPAHRSSSSATGIGTTKEAVTAVHSGASCSSADMWLFDNTSGTGNKLCLYQNGTTLGYIYLYNVCRITGIGGRCSAYWATNNGSGGYDSAILSWYAYNYGGALMTYNPTGTDHTDYTCAYSYIDSGSPTFGDCAHLYQSESNNVTTDSYPSSDAPHWYAVEICNQDDPLFNGCS
jgi:hypothetical protein